MGGNITLNSIVGQGTTFIVSIPQKIVNSSSSLSENLNNNAISEVVDNSPKILIVDDSTTNLKIEQRYMQHFGLDADICYSGEECLEKINSGKIYDVILMDDMMPGISGTETMQKLKNEYKYSKPIIVLTANAVDTQRDEYLAKGFDDFVSKPVSREDLYKVVKSIFNTAKKQQSCCFFVV